MVRLVSLGTAGLSDDLLHVLNLALAAGEGAELEKNELVFGSRGFEINYLLAGWINGHAWDVDLVPQGGEKNQIVKS